MNLKAHRPGFFDKPVDELLQVFFVFFVMICGEMAGAHKRSHASSCFEDAGAFQLGVDLGDRVGIHAQLHRQLSDSWQLLPDPQPSRRDRKLDRLSHQPL